MKIIQVDANSEEYTKSLVLRNEILRKPLGLDIFKEDLSAEKEQIHFVAVQNEQVQGVVVLVPDLESKLGKLRQMATAETIRGRGIGIQLVEELERFSKSTGIEKIRLHARYHAAGFYLKLGYKIVSEEFQEVGIPHFAMEKTL